MRNSFFFFLIRAVDKLKLHEKNVKLHDVRICMYYMCVYIRIRVRVIEILEMRDGGTNVLGGGLFFNYKLAERG